MPPPHAQTLDRPAPTDAAPGRPLPRPPRARITRRGDWPGYALLALLLGATAWVSRTGLYTAASDTGYWLGVAGGIGMLLLFAYPLRKRVPALARAGRAKHWFVVHMVLGIFGPLLILAHSTFRIGSLNAGVALFSMLVVAASGVAGRFIYLRTHGSLGGERLNLAALREQLGGAAGTAQGALSLAPEAAARLLAAERHAGQPGDGWRELFLRLLWLPWHLRRERRLCLVAIDSALRRQAHEGGQARQQLLPQRRQAHEAVQAYVATIQRVAQFSAYARLFSLWHVLHVPFVVLMVLCAVVHVIAVHAY